MRNGINWAALTETGRAKAIGVPWSEKELQAVYELKIPVEYVRNGHLTIESYERAIASHKESPAKPTPLRYMKKPELVQEAQNREMDFDPFAITRPDLILLIEQHDNPQSDLTDPALPDGEGSVQESVGS